MLRQKAIRFIRTQFLTPARWWWTLGLLLTVPALLLAWLGLRAARAERIEQQERLRQQRVQLTHLTDAAITAVIDGFERELRRADANPGEARPDLLLFTFEKRGFLIFDSKKVYAADTAENIDSKPAPVPLPLRAEQLIEQAQAAEAQGRSSEALNIYRRIVEVVPQLSDWAKLRIAHMQYEGGDSSVSVLLTSPVWSESNGLTPTGLPVALLACAYAEHLPTDQLRDFVPLIEKSLDRLRAGSWWLHYEERLFYDGILIGLLKRADESRHTVKDQSLDEVAAITRLTVASPPSRRDNVTLTFMRDQIGAFLILWLPSDRSSDVWLGVAVSENHLANLLDDALLPLLESQQFGVLLRDAHGNVIWRSRGGSQNVQHAEVLRSLAGWEIAFADPPSRGLVDEKLMLWYGFIAVLVMTLMTGLVMTVRVVRREAELARMQNDFVAAVSHDFKSPITSIRLLMERISNRGMSRITNLNEYYVAINHETRRLERYVNRLLEAQQIQEGRRQYTLASATIAPILKRVVDELGPQAKAKHIRMEIESAHDVPEVCIDEEAVSDAIENLVDNAIKYSPENACIRVALRLVNGAVCIEVSDQGIGIDTDDLPRVFDRFYRGRRAAAVRGTGLGLTLVKNTAEAHGGSVIVESEPGKGSRFLLQLPITNGVEHGADSDS